MKAEAHVLADATQTRKLDEGAVMLARHIAGEPRAFEELVNHFGGSVYGYLARAGIRTDTADDLFQETFMRVHSAARRYDPSHPFRVWLFTITNNLIRSHFRKKKVRRILVGWFRRSKDDPHGQPQEMDPADDGPGPDQQSQAKARAEWLRQAIAELPESSRQALVLTQLEGLSQAEAAQVLGVPVPTIKTWVRRGRLLLAQALEKEGEREDKEQKS
jgi:RNA polymerase sigma factor CnrH